jgi:DNA-binding NtrC family response regulator
VSSRAGLFEAAQGGTIFLDEIGELPLGMQAKLLEVLEERAVRRVGSTQKKPVDVRVLSATNRDLETAAAEGRFRADLWFRLNGIALVVPPLRERPGEIAGLARAFVDGAARQSGRAAPGLDPRALAALERLPWPGNIRELRNALERAVLLCGDGPILPEHLPMESVRSTVYARPAPSRPRLAATPPQGSAPAVPPAPAPADPKEAERQRIAAALEHCGGNQGRAAELLGISRRTLVTRLSEFGLPRPRKR